MTDMVKVVRKRKLHEPDDSLEYWLSVDPSERVAMVQELRAEHHGWEDAAGPRLQRVHRVLRRS
jgi:hypothetical protein